MATVKTGRPPGLLTSDRRRELRRIAARATRHDSAYSEARTELARAAREAQLEGASVREIGRAIGMGASTVHSLIHNDDEKGIE